MASTPIPELIARLNDADESDDIEAKRSTNELGKSALETIAAFANEPGAGGGYLIFGLKEDSDNHQFHTAGVHEPKKIETDVSTLCANSFNISIRPKIWTERIDGKAIVAVRIPEAQPREKPVFIASRGMNKGAFRRISVFGRGEEVERAAPTNDGRRVAVRKTPRASKIVSGLASRLHSGSRHGVDAGSRAPL